MYQEAKTRLANKACLETREQGQGNRDRVFFVTKPKSKKDLEAQEEKRQQEEEEELQRCVGFAHVLRHIVQMVKFYAKYVMCFDSLQDFYIPRLDCEKFSN